MKTLRTPERIEVLKKAYAFIKEADKDDTTWSDDTGIMAELFADFAQEYAQTISEGKDREIEELKGESDPWPLVNVVEKLVFAAEYLLHKKDYDGHNYEEIEICVKRGKEIIAALNKVH